jgi:NDP-sugar pyrophosphorylase family protein
VKIVGSYIWNGATVADGATISYSIVCNEARIMAGAVVDKASLVSFRVRLLSRVCRVSRVANDALLPRATGCGRHGCARGSVRQDRAGAGGGERRGGV